MVESLVKNPDIIETSEGFERRTPPAGPGRYEGGEFFRCYAIVQGMTMEAVKRQLLKLGSWPYDRQVVRVLGWEEAVRRLKDEVKSALAMARMVVAIEDQHHQLYLVRAPDIVSGVRSVHKLLQDGVVRSAVDDAFRR